VSSTINRIAQTMKLNRLLAISIPIGILLSACAMTHNSGQTGNSNTSSLIATAKGPVHHGPLPNYVKHNQGIELLGRKIKSNCPGAKAHIHVQLVEPKNDNRAYIRYLITDKYDDGTPGEWHSNQDPDSNETPKSALFTTTFDFHKDITVNQLGNEVTVTGTPIGLNGVTKTWTSDSTNANDSNIYSDVKWKEPPLQ
jgi:hypothetical protein